MPNSCTAYALVRHVESGEDELRFRDFRLWKCTGAGRVRDAGKLLGRGSSIEPERDWVYERRYEDVPDNFGSVPFDVLETLLLLRLFKPGEISFVRHTVHCEGEILRQGPLRTMTEMWAPYPRYYVLHQAQCAEFDHFADRLRTSAGWHSAWFKTAQNFFLYGAAKEFEPDYGLVDRIVDYMIALEASIVPEKDNVSRYLRERGMRIISDNEHTSNTLKKFYDIRSAIAHGSALEQKQIVFVKQHADEFEALVRRVLVAAVYTLAADEKTKAKQLRDMFDVDDCVRVELLRQRARSLRNTIARNVFAVALHVTEDVLRISRACKRWGITER